MTYDDTTSPFIDAHCHLFNIIDVPLYEAIMGKINMGTANQLLAALGIGIGALDLPKVVMLHRNFLRFFEREIAANILWLNTQISEAVIGNNGASSNLRVFGYGKTGKQRIIITPLAIDFDENILKDDKATEIGRDIASQDQFKRLADAINTVGPGLDNLEIYPFAGLALNKLDNGTQALEDFKKWWKQNAFTSEERYKGKLQRLLPFGKAVGIKLYPPLGFNPYPNDIQLRSKYLSFFRWCVEEDIPITVHCQQSSFTAAEDSDRIAERTHPRNWEKLLSDNSELSRLRINFGHFGGSSQLQKMMDRADQSSSEQSIKDNWTLAICRILCQYPNTYADISAFALEDSQTCKNLASLLGVTGTSTGNSSLPNQEILRNKIVWGSDLPMIISSSSFLDSDEKPSYGSLLERFRTGIGCTSPHAENAMEVFNRVTRTNPANFLFGSQ